LELLIVMNCTLENYLEKKFGQGFKVDNTMPARQLESGDSLGFNQRTPSILRGGYSPRIHAVIQEARKKFGHPQLINPEELNLDSLRDRMQSIRPEDVNERLNSLSWGEVGYVSLE